MHPIESLLIPLGRALRNRHADEALSIANAHELATTHRVPLGSPNFGDGEEIPARHCGRFIGDNVSPALTWGPLPAGTADLVLVMEDLDSPGRAPRIHTVAAVGSTRLSLTEGALNPENPAIRFLPTRRRRPGQYAGPRPLPGHGPHHYRFHVYALDRAVDLGTIGDVTHLPAALNGHVLASGVLTGSRTC